MATSQQGGRAKGKRGGRPAKRATKQPAAGMTLDALARIVREMPVDRLRAVLKRDRQFTFRLSEMDRVTMNEAAKVLEVPVAEYLIRLHWAAYESLREAGDVATTGAADGGM